MLLWWLFRGSNDWSIACSMLNLLLTINNGEAHAQQEQYASNIFQSLKTRTLDRSNVLQHHCHLHCKSKKMPQEHPLSRHATGELLLKRVPIVWSIIRMFTSSKTFLSPFCVRAEHSTYFTALNSFARRSPISRLSGFCLFFAESRRCWYLCLWKTWTASRSKCKALFLKYLVHVQSN